MIRLNTAAITLCLLGALPMAVSAQSSGFGPEEGEGNSPSPGPAVATRILKVAASACRAILAGI